MNTQPLIVIQRELDILKKYLQESILTDFNRKSLLSQLASAQVVKEDELPGDAIGLNCSTCSGTSKQAKFYL